MTTLSYGGAGVAAPASNGLNDDTYFKKLFDSIFAGHNTDYAALNTSIGTLNTTIAGHTTTLAAATDANTVSTIVKRNAGGDFSARNVFATLFAGTLQGSAGILNAYTGGGSATGFAIKGYKQDATTAFDALRIRKDTEGNALEFAKRLYYDDAGAGTTSVGTYGTWGTTDPALVMNKTWLVSGAVPPAIVEPIAYLLGQSTSNTVAGNGGTAHAGVKGVQGLYINMRDHASVAGNALLRGSNYGLGIEIHQEASRSDPPYDDTAAISISLSSGGSPPAKGWKGTEAIYIGGGYWGDWIGMDGYADIGIRIGGLSGRDSVTWYPLDIASYGYTAAPTRAGGIRLQDGRRSAIRVAKASTPADPTLDQAMISADGAGFVYIGSEYDSSTPPMKVSYLGGANPSVQVWPMPAQTGDMQTWHGIAGDIHFDNNGNVVAPATISAGTNLVSGGFIYGGPPARPIQIGDADGFVTAYSQAVGGAYVSGTPATSIVFKGGSWYSGSTRLTLPQTTVTYNGAANANLVGGVNPTVPTTARIDAFYFDPVTNKVGFISGTDASSPTTPVLTSAHGAPGLQVKARSNVGTTGITPLVFGGSTPTDTGTNSFIQADLRTGGSPFNPFAQTVVSNIVPAGVSTGTTDATLADMEKNGYTANLPGNITIVGTTGVKVAATAGSPVAVEVGGSWRKNTADTNTLTLTTNGSFDIFAETSGASAGQFVIASAAAGGSPSATQRKIATAVVVGNVIVVASSSSLGTQAVFDTTALGTTLSTNIGLVAATATNFGAGSDVIAVSTTMATPPNMGTVTLNVQVPVGKKVIVDVFSSREWNTSTVPASLYYGIAASAGGASPDTDVTQSYHVADAITNVYRAAAFRRYQITSSGQVTFSTRARCTSATCTLFTGDIIASVIGII